MYCPSHFHVLAPDIILDGLFLLILAVLMAATVLLIKLFDRLSR
jgi:hypothetical protein